MTQDVRLGGYADATEVTHTEATGVLIQPVHEVQNMETYNLDGTIEREYLIQNIEWTTDQAAEVELATMKFPKVLFDIPYIKDKIKGFRYFIGAVRVSVRVTSNRFCYGKLMMAYDPMHELNTGKNMDSCHAMSGNPHVLISADASETVVFDIPFVSNKRALDILNYSDGEIAMVRLRILNQLHDVMGNANSASIQVTAQFIETKMFFPHDQDYAAASKMVLQSGRRPIVRDRQAELQARQEVAQQQMQEAYEKSRAHIVSSAEEHTKAAVGKSGIMRFVHGAGEIANTAMTVMAAAAMFGLSKPSTLARTDVVQVQPMQGYANGKGIDYAVKLGMSNENSIGTAPVVGGRPCDEMNIVEIVSTPMLIASHAVLPDTEPLPVAPIGPQIEGGPFKFAYVDYISDMFAFISGSYKIKVYITASQMQAVKGVFYLTDDETDDMDWRNSYHRMVDICGDTDVEIMLPYCYQKAMVRTRAQLNFTLWFKVLNWSTPDKTIDAPIYLNMYKAGTKDFQCGQLMERVYTKPATAAVRFSENDLVDSTIELQSNPRDDFRKDFEPLHPSMTGYQHDGLVMGEQFTTLREVVHKYSPYNTTDKNGFQIAYRPYINGTQAVGLEQVGQLFRFWRGSVRMNFTQNVSTRNFAVVVKDSSSNETRYIHTAGFGTNMNPCVEVELPYWEDEYFKSTDFDSGNRVYVCGTGTFLFSKAAGDDFSFHFLKCPDSRLTNGASAYGFSALASLYNN